MKRKIKYFSQFESINLVDKILRREILAKQDPKWQQSGANTPEEYQHWSWNICGMACLKMILYHKTHKVYSTIELAKQCLQYGGYKIKENDDDIDGLYYYPFAEYASKELHLEVEVNTNLTYEKIAAELGNNHYPIISVCWQIKLDDLVPIEKKGGHLVLVVGYNEKAKELYIHNPSGYYKHSQKCFTVSEERLNHYFANRGLIIK